MGSLMRNVPTPDTRRFEWVLKGLPVGPQHPFDVDLFGHSDFVVCPSAPILKRVDISAPPSGWGKVDIVKELAGVRSERFPDLYYIRADELVDFDVAEKSIREFSNGRVVCRTDSIATQIEKLNLPRTHSVSPSKAVQFMRSTLSS